MPAGEGAHFTISDGFLLAVQKSGGRLLGTLFAPSAEERES